MRSRPKHQSALNTREQNPEADQRLLDIAARRDADEGIRQGLEDAKRGKVWSAKKFFTELEARHGLSR